MTSGSSFGASVAFCCQAAGLRGARGTFGSGAVWTLATSDLVSTSCKPLAAKSTGFVAGLRLREGRGFLSAFSLLLATNSALGAFAALGSVAGLTVAGDSAFTSITGESVTTGFVSATGSMRGLAMALLVSSIANE